MFKNLVDAFKIKEIRRKFYFTILLVLVYRLGCWIPVPGLVANSFKELVNSGNGEGFLALLSAVSGGALSNGAILALGVSPYISSSIIIQLLTIAIPRLERLSKMGEEGKKRIATYTKYCALVLAVLQAVAIVIGYRQILNTEVMPEWVVGCLVTVVLVAGSMFTYWLGEKITSIGLVNGLSAIIFVGILSTAATSILNTITTIAAGGEKAVESGIELAIFVVALVLIFGFIVFMDMSERKIPVQYAKQVKGRKMYGGQSTHIPIRVNATGVMPIIFAMSLLSFPQLIMSIFWPESKFYQTYSLWLGAGSWIYMLLVGILITFFAYFWTQITFNPEDVSKNIQQNGGFIPGIRPGKPTAEYLKKISNRITLFGAIFLSIIAIVPSLIFKSIGSGSLVGVFSATGLLIVVSVAIEFDKQLEAQMLMRNYKGFLK